MNCAPFYLSVSVISQSKANKAKDLLDYCILISSYSWTLYVWLVFWI